jgi:glycosyltransferase involved in cell wall biosynthesis
VNILLSAYACEPGKGSEPGTGWNTCISLANYCHVTVLTRTNNRQLIEANLRDDSRCLENPTFIYYDLPVLIQQLKAARLLPMRLYYVLWQFCVYRHLQKICSQKTFDIVHHLTFNTFEIPGLLHKLNIPFVWGPIGGGQTVTLSSVRWFGSSAGSELLRKIRIFLTRWSPNVLAARKHARAILYANRETIEALPPLNRTKALEVLDVGVAPQPRKPRPAAHDPAVGVILGRLEARKGVHLALQIVCYLRDRNVKAHLHFVGDGPLRSYIDDYISKHELQEYLTLSAAVDHAQVPSLLNNSDFLLFPSLRDTSGSVVLEAMVVGLPTVAVNHQGAARMLNTTCGILVDPAPYKSLAARMATAIEQLISNPSRMADFSIKSHARAMTHFTWDAKARLFASVYHEVVDAKERPS